MAMPTSSLTLTPNLRRSLTKCCKVEMSELIHGWNNFAELLANWIGSSGLQGNWCQLANFLQTIDAWHNECFYIFDQLNDRRARHLVLSSSIGRNSTFCFLVRNIWPAICFLTFCSLSKCIRPAAATWQGASKITLSHQQLSPIYLSPSLGGFAILGW